MERQELHSTASRSADIDIAFFDLNSISEQDLARIEGLNPELARVICQHRPFGSMEDVRHVPGMTDDRVDLLLRAGAMVGDPTPAGKPS